MTDINGRTAVVTGGGSGIGCALAMALAKAGAAVAVADIMPDKAEAVAADIRAAGGQAMAVQCDVCDRASLQRMKEAVTAQFGSVQLVFANAGATSFMELTSMSDDDVDWIFQVNLMGTLNTIRTFLPEMQRERGGHIVATASMAGLLPGWMPVHAPYSAAKAGIIGLVMNLSLELQAFDIGTTIYCPGGVASGMKANNGKYRPEQFGGPLEDGSLQISSSAKHIDKLTYYHPDAVAPMVLNAVVNNRPFVFDHADQRHLFKETYSDIVEACYDDIENWEREHGLPPANPTGVDLA